MSYLWFAAVTEALDVLLGHPWMSDRLRDQAPIAANAKRIGRTVLFWLQNSALVSTAALDDQYALVLLHKSPQAPVDVSRMCGRQGDSVPNALEVLLYEAHFRWFLHIWLN